MFDAIVFCSSDSGQYSERSHAEYWPDGIALGYVEFSTAHKPAQCQVVAFITAGESGRDSTTHYGARPRVYDGEV